MAQIGSIPASECSQRNHVPEKVSLREKALHRFPILPRIDFAVSKPQFINI
jgi:hypothetical protein